MKFRLLDDPVLVAQVELILKATRKAREHKEMPIATDAIMKVVLLDAVSRAIALSPRVFDTIVPLLDKAPLLPEERDFINAQLERLVAPD